jgi:hypothetical protein
VAGSRRAAFPLGAMLCGGLGLALAGCGASSPAASAPATVTVTASAPTGTASAAAPAAASGKPVCPTAAAVSAAAGTAYLPPTADTAADGLNCSYQAKAGLLLISFDKAEFPASDLKQLADNQAVAQGGVKFTPVSGIGDAAYLFSVKGPGEAAGRELIVQSGSRAITILGAGNIGQLKAIARMAIAS